MSSSSRKAKVYFLAVIFAITAILAITMSGSSSVHATEVYPYPSASLELSVVYDNDNNKLDMEVSGGKEGYSYQFWVKTLIKTDNNADNSITHQYVWSLVQSYTENGNSFSLLNANEKLPTKEGDKVLEKYLDENGSYNVIARIKDKSDVVDEIYGVRNFIDVGRDCITSVSVGDRVLESNRTVLAGGTVPKISVTANRAGLNFSVWYNGAELANNKTGIFDNLQLNSLTAGEYTLELRAGAATQKIVLHMTGDYNASNKPVIDSLDGETQPNGETEFTVKIKNADGTHITEAQRDTMSFELISGNIKVFQPTSKIIQDDGTMDASFDVDFKAGKFGIYYTTLKVSSIDTKGNVEDTANLWYYGYATRPAEVQQTSDATLNDADGRYYAETGDTIKITALNGKINNSSENIQYAFYREDASGWREIRKYDASPEFTWMPLMPGLYNIQVRAKHDDAGSFEAIASKVYVVGSNTLSGTVELEIYAYGEEHQSNTFVAGMPYILSAKYTKGNQEQVQPENLMYLFILSSKNMQGVYLKYYSVSPEYVFVPMRGDIYNITARVISTDTYGYMEKSCSRTIFSYVLKELNYTEVAPIGVSVDYSSILSGAGNITIEQITGASGENPLIVQQSKSITYNAEGTYLVTFTKDEVKYIFTQTVMDFKQISGQYDYELNIGSSLPLTENTEDFVLNLPTQSILDSSNSNIYTLVSLKESFIVEGTVSGDSVVTIDRASLSNVPAGEYKLIIRTPQLKQYEINVALITKIIDSTELLAIFDFSNLTNVDYGYYVLGNNIDATGYTHIENTRHTPADQATAGFRGVVDGRGYTIDGITFSSGGLLGFVGKGGQVRNIGFTKVKFVAENHAVVIANYLTDDAVVENIYIQISAWAGAYGQYGNTGLIFNTYHTVGDEPLIRDIVLIAEDATGTPRELLAHQDTQTGTVVAVWQNVHVISSFVNPVAISGVTYHSSSSDYQDSEVKFNAEGKLYWQAAGAYPVFDSIRHELEQYIGSLETIYSFVPGDTLQFRNDFYVALLGEYQYASTQNNILTIDSQAAEGGTFNILVYHKIVNSIAVAMQVTVTLTTEVSDYFELFMEKSASLNGMSGVLAGDIVSVKVTDSTNTDKTFNVTASKDGAITIPAGALTGLRGGEVRAVVNADANIYQFTDLLLVTKVIEEASDLAVFDFSILETVDYGYYVLGNNIDATSYTHLENTFYARSLRTEYGFRGVLDGRGYTIDGITFSDGGLLGFVGKSGQVRNIGFTNVSFVVGKNYAVAIATYLSSDSVVENIYIQVSAWASTNQHGNTGLIFNVHHTVGAKPLIRDIVLIAEDATGKPKELLAQGTTVDAVWQNVHVISSFTDPNAKSGAIYHKSSSAYQSAGVKFNAEGKPYWNTQGTYPVFASTISTD